MSDRIVLKGVSATGFHGVLDFKKRDGQTFVVDVARLHHKNPVTPYAGRTLTGTVRATWLRGAPIDLADDPRGRLLRRGER